MALVLTGVLVLSPMTVSAAESATAEAVKAAAEAAAAASKAAEEAAAAAQAATSATQAAQASANAAAQAANAAASAAQTAANAATQAAGKSGTTTDNSTNYGSYYVDNRVTNNYTYKITITNSNGSSKKNPKVTITGGGSSGGGSKVSITEGPFFNTISKAPGLDNVIPVGQGGKLVIGGVKTRATFVMRETNSGTVSSAKTLAAQIGGSVKNVVETYARGVRFSTCQVDFKVYGCKNGDVYRVFQLMSDGTWKEVQVDDIHEGHVVCTVNKAGTFAFIKMN